MSDKTPTLDEIKAPRNEDGKFEDKELYEVVRRRVGQPKLYLTPEHLAFKALEFLEWCKQSKNKVTMAGMRVWIDFSRQNWSDYKTKYPEYFDTMNMIESLLEAEWEGKLGWAGSTQGAIFWLKNKSGWKDEVQQNVRQLTEVKPEVVVPKGTPPIASSESEIK